MKKSKTGRNIAIIVLIVLIALAGLSYITYNKAPAKITKQIMATVILALLLLWFFADIDIPASLTVIAIGLG